MLYILYIFIFDTLLERVAGKTCSSFQNSFREPVLKRHSNEALALCQPHRIDALINVTWNYQQITVRMCVRVLCCGTQRTLANFLRNSLSKMVLFAGNAWRNWRSMKMSFCYIIMFEMRPSVMPISPYIRAIWLRASYSVLVMTAAKVKVSAVLMSD